MRGVLDRKMTLTVVAGVPLAAEYAAVGRAGPGHLAGIHHAKSLMVGNKVLVGSTNWTTSSRSNWELGVAVEVDAVFLPSVEEMFQAGWMAGTDLGMAQIAEAQRARSASAGASRRRG